MNNAAAITCDLTVSGDNLYMTHCVNIVVYSTPVACK